jgi:pimeloyl-[acyl-carrier protein] methyl ester esterase
MKHSLYYDLFSHSDAINPADPDQEWVLLHGWGMNASVWDAIIPGLLRHHPVRLIELPGMGRSLLRSQRSNLDEWVDQVLEVAPSRAIWMGWSLGGLVAMAATLLEPQRVSQLITVATTPRFTQSTDWSCALPDTELTLFRQWLEEDPEGTLIRFLALQCKGSRMQRSDIRYLQERAFLHGQPAWRALREGLAMLADVDLRQGLGEIQPPCLHIYGEHDALVPASVARQMQHDQPMAQVVVIPGAAHLPFVTEPEVFLTHVRGFLGLNTAIDGAPYD